MRRVRAQPQSHYLELRQGFAKLFPHQHMVAGILKASMRSAHAASSYIPSVQAKREKWGCAPRTNVHAASVQRPHCYFEPIPLVADHVRRRHLHVFHDHCARGLGVPPQLGRCKLPLRERAPLLSLQGAPPLPSLLAIALLTLLPGCSPLHFHHNSMRHQKRTFFSFLPNESPGVSFSMRKQEIPLGVSSPVRHITKYTSLSPPPLINACAPV